MSNFGPKFRMHVPLMFQPSLSPLSSKKSCWPMMVLFPSHLRQDVPGLNLRTFLGRRATDAFLDNKRTCRVQGGKAQYTVSGF
jgi:hypothetical protein